MYANTRFQTEVDEWGRVKKEILPGDKVSQSDLDVSDEEWQNMIDRNLVVEDYPKDLDPNTPLAKYYREKDDRAATAETLELELPKEEKQSEPTKAPEPAKAQAPQTSPAQSEQK